MNTNDSAMPIRYDGRAYEGHCDFTIAFPHGTMPGEQELNEFIWTAIEEVDKLLDKTLPRYSARVGDVSSYRIMYHGDCNWSVSRSGDEDN